MLLVEWSNVGFRFFYFIIIFFNYEKELFFAIGQLFNKKDKWSYIIGRLSLLFVTFNSGKM